MTNDCSILRQNIAQGHILASTERPPARHLTGLCIINGSKSAVRSCKDSASYFFFMYL